MTSDMKLYPDRIANALTSIFPELGDVGELTFLGDGFRSLVVETAQGEVFKIAKNWDGGAGFSKEYRLLPLIRDLLPVAVPYPVWLDGASKHVPFGVIGYPKLPGEQFEPSQLTDVDSDVLARQVAGFLVALHRLEITSEIAGCIPEPRTYWDQLERLRNTLSPALRELFPPGDYRTISRWWDGLLEDSAMHEYRPVLHHGDYWHGNMLLDTASTDISGILDWENAALGDPAQDFATLLHLGRPFALAVLREYQAAGGILDEDLLYRTQRLWELREFVGIGFAIHTTNQQEFDDAVRKLRNGPLLNEATRRDTSVWPPQQR